MALRTPHSTGQELRTNARQWFTMTACLVLGSLWLTACSDAPQEVSPSVLVAEHERLDGQVVVTYGQVNMFEDPYHYWLEDDDLHRIALEPASEVTDLVGREVQVRGRFSSSLEQGRKIAIESVTVLD